MSICLYGPDTGRNALTTRSIIGLSENHCFLNNLFQENILNFFKTYFVHQPKLNLVFGLPLISKESNIVHSVYATCVSLCLNSVKFPGSSSEATWLLVSYCSGV